ncbi:hypothetical protein [Thauera humireducens]|uniref:hypothetical protein n=1 Tax=Thauera humireducens TaxID=1134435 RepID=UPI00311E295E
MEPLAALAAFGLRLKLQQSSLVPQRAPPMAPGTSAAPGCAPAAAGRILLFASVSGSAEWQQRLNEVGARLWLGASAGGR